MEYIKSLFMKEFLIRDALLKDKVNVDLSPEEEPVEAEPKEDISEAIKNLSGKAVRNNSAI